MEIRDIIEAGIPGPAGTITPTAQAALDLIDEKWADVLERVDELNEITSAGVAATLTTPGPARDAFGSTGRDMFAILRGERGVTQTIYVREDGNDVTGDGTTAATAYREIRTAVAQAVATRGPVVRGTVVINVGAGSYKGGINLATTRNPAQDDFIRIIGPNVGGHPNAPTAIIDYSLDNTYDYGVRAFDGMTLMLTDIKFVGAFRYAIDARRGPYVYLTNVHGVGPGKTVAGSVFFGSLDYVNYYMLGGVITDYERGIQEHGQVRRHFENVSSPAEGTQIKRCGVGLFAKEGCGGHLDYLQIEDCGTGIRFHTMCNANMLMVSVKRNDVGIFITDSEIHNEGSIIFGSGADANGRAIVSLGSSTELAYLGWTGDNEKTIRTGHRALTLLDSDYASRIHTGDTAEVTRYTFPNRLKRGMYAVQGRRFEVRMVGSVTASPTTATGVRVLVRVEAQFTAEVTIPQGAPVGADFEIVFTVLCTADGNVQKCWGKLTGLDNAGLAAYAARTLPLGPEAERTVNVSLISGAVADSVTIQVCELWG